MSGEQAMSSSRFVPHPRSSICAQRFPTASTVLYGHRLRTLSGLAGMLFLCKHASLIPLNKPIQAFGVSYGAKTDLGVSLTAPGQRFAAQCGCFLIVAPTQILYF